MLTAGTGCPRCSRARAAIRPADTERRATSRAPAAGKISRDSLEKSLRWRRNGAAKKGTRFGRSLQGCPPTVAAAPARARDPCAYRGSGKRPEGRAMYTCELCASLMGYVPGVVELARAPRALLWALRGRVRALYCIYWPVWISLPKARLRQRAWRCRIYQNARYAAGAIVT